MTRCRLLLISSAVFVFCTLAIPSRLPVSSGYLLHAADISLSVQADAARQVDSEPPDDRVMVKKKLAVMALFLLTLTLLLVTFLLIAGIIYIRRSRRKLATRTPQKTELEDLWWKIKDDNIDTDKEP